MPDSALDEAKETVNKLVKDGLAAGPETSGVSNPPEASADNPDYPAENFDADDSKMVEIEC